MEDQQYNDLLPKKYQDSLKSLKKDVTEWYQYWRENIILYNNMRKFTFKTGLTEEDKSLLQQLGKPQIEANIVEAYLSRSRGEFAKQEPSLTVTADYGAKVDPKIIEIIEGHQRHFIYEGKKNNTEFDAFSQTTSGGYSVFEVWTDYANPLTFEQDIYCKTSTDPTMYGFDPMAKVLHKGDGRFCFKVTPMTEDDFKRQFPKVNIEQISYIRDVEGFSFSYRGQKEKILLVIDMYRKKFKKVKLHKLADGNVTTDDKYKEYLKYIEENNIIIQPLQIVESRTTTLETICRYRFIENQVLEYKETDWINLPFVFVDGNSVYLKDSEGSASYQMIRPLCYHSVGAQRLKNYALQTYGAWIENMVMHKWKVAKEGIPPEYKDAYINPQQASTLVYNAYKDNDPNIPVPAPMEIQVAPMPPEVAGLFNNMDQTIQSIQGTYDNDMARASQNQITGIGMENAMTISNLAQMPYIVGFMVAWNQVCTIHLDLFAKYVKSERTIPIMGADGKKNTVTINQPGGIEVKYPERSLKVHVEAGVNFSIQKSRALNQLIQLMNVSPLFAQFMNVEGLPVLLDNLEIRGVDQLKLMAEQWQEQMKQQQAQQQKMMQEQQQNSPAMLKLQLDQQKIQLDAKKNQTEAALKAAKVGIDQMNADTDRIKVMLDAGMSRAEHALQHEKHNTEKYHSATELALKAASQHNQHDRELMGLQHKILESIGKQKESRVE